VGARLQYLFKIFSWVWVLCVVTEYLPRIIESAFENDWLLDVKFGPEVAHFTHVLNEFDARDRFDLFDVPLGKGL
jgi:hypothetical protein